MLLIPTFIQSLNKCQSNCKNKDCLKNLTLRGMVKKRSAFWSKKPNREQRRAKIETILKEARQAYLDLSAKGTIDPCQHPNKLVFFIDGSVVCEKAYVNMLGLANDKGAISKVWKDQARLVTGNQ